MNRTQVTLIKLGGSLITHKRDENLIREYLNIVDRFLSGVATIGELNKIISRLMNFNNLDKIFRTLSDFLKINPSKKIILIHGAGSIGHSLVLHLLKSNLNLQKVYPIIKLVVSIQNQFIVSTGIKYELNVISMTSHQILQGFPTNEVSTRGAIAQDLKVIEDIIKNSNAIPTFYGDVGFTPTGWKVFSGDIIPSALLKRFSRIWIKNAIFLTDVDTPNKRTGIYTKDPSFDDAKYISRIEVQHKDYVCYGINNEILSFKGEESKKNEKFDVTDAMGGKMRNLLELAANFTHCWVVGLEEFADSLNNKNVGTMIIPKSSPRLSIRFLGIGDAFSSGGNSNAGVFVKTKDLGILIDCGQNILSTLKKYKLTTNDIDLMLISHFHGDHFAGIPFFLLDANILQKRKKPLHIVGPNEIAQRISKLYHTLYDTISKEELSFPCLYTNISQNELLKVNNVEIKAYKTHHTPESLGFRIKINELNLAYTGDTGWTDNLIPMLDGTDLSIIECSFYKYELETHLNFKQIINLISRVNVKQIILNHLGSEGLSEINAIAKKYDIIIPIEGQFLLV